MSPVVIDINQRIPLSVLDAALISCLHDNYSSSYMEERLRLEFSGENRIKKALRLVSKIVPESALLPLLKSNKPAVLQALKKTGNRNIILIALLNSSFEFSFDCTQNLAKLFYAQELVSRAALRRQIAKKYGGNRALENAIDSVIPMLIEGGLFVRSKPGLYKWNGSIRVTNSIVGEIWTGSQRNAKLTGIDTTTDRSDPYFIFIEEQ